MNTRKKKGPEGPFDETKTVFSLFWRKHCTSPCQPLACQQTKDTPLPHRLVYLGKGRS